MKNVLLGGIAAALALAVAPQAASAQEMCGVGPCERAQPGAPSPRAEAPRAPAPADGGRYQNRGYANGYNGGRFYGNGFGYNRGYGYGNGYGYRGGYGRYYGNDGGDVAAGVAGLAAGAIIGGAVASQNGYYAEYQGGGRGYCARHYRSYDPASGTYVGYDGMRHACP